MIGKLVMECQRRKKHPHSHALEVALQALYQIEIAEKSVFAVLKLEWLNEPLEEEARELCEQLVIGVSEHWEALEEVILSFSDIGITRISTVVRCILRMAFFELIMTDLSRGIIMNDYLNLTRKYDGEDSTAFVHGILDQYEKVRIKVEPEFKKKVSEN